jgi:hypothetical protein
MTTLAAFGIPYSKPENECAHPHCRAFIDFRKHDKPPPGWAHVVLSRYGKKANARAEMLVCPKHTINFTERQSSLLGRAKSLIRTIIESPFAGDRQRNESYLNKAIAHSLQKSEAPFASHAIYTKEGILDDTKPAERRAGIDAGLAWSEVAQKAVVYTDLGITDGMREGIERHKANGKIVEYRQLPNWQAEDGSGTPVTSITSEMKGLHHED